MHIDDLKRCALQIGYVADREFFGFGTGCLIKGGHVITAYHVISSWVQQSESGNQKQQLIARYFYSKNQKRYFDLKIEYIVGDESKDVAVFKIPIDEVLPSDMIEAHLDESTPRGNYVAYGFGSRDFVSDSNAKGELLGTVKNEETSEQLQQDEIQNEDDFLNSEGVDEATIWLQLSKAQIWEGMSGGPILKLDNDGVHGSVIGLIKTRGKKADDDFALGIPLKNFKIVFDEIINYYPNLASDHSTIFDITFGVNTNKFIGRERELAWLEKKVMDGVKLIGIVGEPGSGKSSLAKQFGEKYSKLFTHGVIGRTVQGQDVETIAVSVLHCFEKRLSEGMTSQQSLSSILNNRHLLLIADNAEDDVIIKLALNPTKSVLLVTTRNRRVLDELGVTPENILDLQQDAYKFSENNATELALSIIGNVSEPEKLAEILSAVGHLPLAVQVISSRIRQKVLRGIVTFDEFLQSIRIFKEKNQLVSELKLNDLFHFSLDALRTENSRLYNLFLKLGACSPLGFTSLIATYLNNSDESVTKWDLDELSNLSLIHLMTNKRFTMHPFVRDFARQEANKLGILKDAEDSYSKYYVQIVINSGKDKEIKIVEGIKTSLSKDEIGLDLPIILFASNWLKQQKDCRLNQAFWRGIRDYFESRGFTAQAMLLVEDFTKISDEIGISDLRAYFYRQLGKAKFQLAKSRSPKKYLDEALDAMKIGLELEERKTGLEGLEAKGKAYTSIGRIYVRLAKQNKKTDVADSKLQHLEQAISYHRKALEIAKQVESLESMSYALNTLAIALAETNLPDYCQEAEKLCVQALEMANGVDPRETVVVIHHYITVLNHQIKILSPGDEQKEKIKKIVELGEFALNLIDKHQIDNPLNELNIVRELMSKLGSYNNSKYFILLKRFITIQGKLSKPSLRKINDLIVELFKHRQYSEAVQYCRQAVQAAEEKNSVRDLALTLKRLGEALLTTNRAREAFIHLEKSLSLMEPLLEEDGISKQYLETKKVFVRTLWAVGQKIEAIHLGWDVYQSLKKDGADKRITEHLLGWIASWLYRLGLQAMADDNRERLNEIQDYFNKIEEEKCENIYIIYEIARYEESKIHYIPAIDYRGIDKCRKYAQKSKKLYGLVIDKVNELSNTGKKPKTIKFIDKSKMALKRLSRYEKGLDTAQNYVANLKYNSEYKTYKDFSYLLINDLTQLLGARTLLERWLNRQRYPSDLLKELGKISRRMGNLDLTKQYYSKLLERSDGFWDYILVADFFAKCKDVEKARKLYEKAQEKKEKSSLPATRLGILYSKHSSDYDVARIYFDRALTLSNNEDNANRLETLLRSIEFFADQRDCDRAEALVSEILRDFPDDPLSIVSIVDSRYLCETIAETEEEAEYIRAIKLAQSLFSSSKKTVSANNNGEGNNKSVILNSKRNLAYCYWKYANFLRRTSPSRAEINYKESVKLSDNTKPDFIADYLIWTLRYGHRAQQERLYEDLARLDPTHPVLKKAEAILDVSEI